MMNYGADELRSSVPTSNYRIGVLTNISLEVDFRWILRDCYRERKVDAEVKIIQLSEYQEMENEISRCNLIVVILDYFTQYQRRYMRLGILDEHGANDNTAFEECRYIYTWLKMVSSCQIIWFGYEDYSAKERYVFGATLNSGNGVDSLNDRLSGLLEEDIFIDMKYLISSIGLDNAYDEKRKVRWNIPYSKHLQKAIAEEIYKQYQIINGCTPKCIILDCDGVLWGGILAEDGMDGIQIGSYGNGRYYRDFQLFLLNLYYHGVLLTVCSKNEIQDVYRVLDEHTGMILKRENIVHFEANWNDKCENIEKIAKHLNISYNSMVFIDDTLAEINAVKNCLPDVRIIHFDKKDIYKQLSCFNLMKNMDVKQVEMRTLYYQTSYLREEIKVGCESAESYRKRLETKIDFHEAVPSELSRIAELINRTNKCTNGARYSVADLKSLCKNTTFKLYAIYVSDKFSDLGLVGALGINQEVVDIFSLSCRALGRGIEQEMIERLLTIGVKEYKMFDTGKNAELQCLFTNSSLYCR